MYDPDQIFAASRPKQRRPNGFFSNLFRRLRLLFAPKWVRDYEKFKAR